MSKGPKQDLGKETKIKVSSPVELPISVTGESPCGQVDFLLDARPLTPRHKVLLWTLTFLYHKAKLSKKKREERKVPFYRCLSLLAPG
jgi:hypothetical protein